MTSHQYLLEVLKSQRIVPGSPELIELDSARTDVEKLLRSAFSESNPTILPGGSLAKGTMIKESYDLDLICYFPNSDDEPGDTIKEIYENVAIALAEEYSIRRKRSAVRIFDKDTDTKDFHIDVVPGRYIDGSQTDCYLHQHNGDKAYLKTNLQKHISHIRDSGVTDAISLMKLWKIKNSLPIKTFVLELLVIDALVEKKNDTLDGQLKHVFGLLKDKAIASVTDPANASNDLSDRFNSDIRTRLANAAETALDTIEKDGWENIFGAIDSAGSQKIDLLRGAAAADASFSRPWGQNS